jgi:RNA polymerase sigma factor (sigma-70 family)
MSNALAGVAYDSVLKYAPVDALRERAVRQTIHACLLLFPLENADLISQVAEEAWQLHMAQHSEQRTYLQRGSQEAGEVSDDVPEYQLLREKLRLHLDDLSLRERQVIELRFGLLDNRCYSREEVGRRMRVTRERIRVIEERALRKLRDYLA